MKVWKGFGSAHSAALTVIGKFKNVDDAQLAEQVVEDFANAYFEKRYSDVETFINAWLDRLPNIMAQSWLTQSDFEIKGIEEPCDVTRSDNIVTVSEMRSAEIGGIIKVMLLKHPDEIKIVGETGP